MISTPPATPCVGVSSAIRDAGLDPAELVGGLVRTAIVPGEGCRLVAADYAAIEARVLARMAGETAALRTFAAGADIYCAAAATMYGVIVEKNGQNAALRKLGKIAVLAYVCGASVASASGTANVFIHPITDRLDI